MIATGLTLSVAAIVLVAFSLILIGPTVAEKLGSTTGWGAPFEWVWLVLQWPLVFALVVLGIGLIYYFGPDADQDWVWITPGAVAAATLWLVISLLFKSYVANFTDYEGSYGTVGGVIVVLLWFYVSSIANLTGAELNAEMEHGSPYGKAPGQKNAQGKLLIGARAERAFRQRQLSGGEAPEQAVPSIVPVTEKLGLGAAVNAYMVEDSNRHRFQAMVTHRTAQTEPCVEGVVDGAINTIAAVGRTRRAWQDARNTGFLQRLGILIVMAGVAFAFAARTKRRHTGYAIWNNRWPRRVRIARHQTLRSGGKPECPEAGAQRLCRTRRRTPAPFATLEHATKVPDTTRALDVVEPPPTL